MRIAITLGDPAGIGPEIALKSLLSEEIAGLCRPLIVGDRTVVEEAVGKLRIPVYLGDSELVDVSVIKDGNFERARPTAAGGRAAAAYIRKAVALALDNSVNAVVTAPISKEALKMAGLSWPGHTEMLAELTGTKDYAMMLTGTHRSFPGGDFSAAPVEKSLRVILVTIHTALKNVPALITRERVLKTILLAKKACDMMVLASPKIAVAGLNPHAGESGMFGREEAEEIVPAVKEAQALGIPVSGPYPADTLFHKAYNGEFDIIVCMYHDQGLIPLKMIAFDKGVNATIGLPVIRTSPDHGTAYDIAWKGIAGPSSMIEAIKLAVRLAAGFGGGNAV